MTHVLIPDYPTRVQFQNGATPASTYAFNFTFFQASDIHVWHNDVEQIPGTNFTVTGNPGTESGFAGGVVTMTSAANSRVTVMRILPLERVSDFPDAGSFNRRTLNTTLDKHVAMIQQIDERVDRTWLQSPTAPALVLIADYFPRVNDAASGFELISPAQVRQAISAQPLDATLTGLAALNVPPGSIIYGTATPDQFATTPITGYTINLLDDPDAPTARSTLGLGTMATQNANAVAITGGTITGVAVTVPGLGTMSTQNANAVAITGGTITGMPVPNAFSDVATKGYADALAFGVNKRSTARVASVANLTVSAIIVGSLVDGVTMVAGDRVLLKDQTNHAQNGVYVVTGPGAPIRASDFDTYDECPGSLVTVQEGTVNADQVWLCTSNAGGVLETTAIDFSKVKVSPDLPLLISQGGTGQITAPLAFDALKQPHSTTYTGVSQVATQTEVNTGTDTLKTVSPATLVSRLSIALAQRSATHLRHDCKLYFSSAANLVLVRYGGQLITIAGNDEVIPAGGVTLPWSGNYGAIAPYFVYAWCPGGPGTAMALYADTAAYVTNSDGNLVHSSNAGMSYVGLFIGGYGGFVQQAGFRGVLSYWNRTPWQIQQAFSGVQTGSTAPVGLVTALQFANDSAGVVQANVSGYGLNNAASTYLVTDMFFNGGGSNGQTISHVLAAGALINIGQAIAYVPPSIGYHYATVMGWVSAGVGSWYGLQTITGVG